MTWFIIATLAAAGLCIGSFLNVVIHRGPTLFGVVDDASPRGDLIRPRSYCPECHAPIRRWPDLAPLIGYAALGGKCRACGAAIPLRYPVVEMLGAAALVGAYLIYGPTVDAGLAAVFFLFLMALGFIDYETGYLPNALTLPLVVIGLAANIGGRFAAFDAALIGAFGSFLLFWGFAELYRALRGRDGLGGGDAKLLAAFGAWCGWTAIAPIVFIASLTALVFVALSAIFRRGPRDSTIRFGPALCAAGAFVFVMLTQNDFAATFSTVG